MMTRQLAVCILATLLLGAALTPQVQAQQFQTLSPAQAALDSARQTHKYLFVLFFKDNDAATQAVGQTLNSSVTALADKATLIYVNTKDSTEKAFVDQYGVSRSPMPLVLAIAPNGAVTGGFPLKLTEQDVVGSLLSPAHAACVKANQARKLAFLCVQPTGAGTELPAGATAFKADPQYNAVTEIVVVQAADPAEAGFLKALGISSSTNVTVTALLAPPRNVVAKFEGPFTKEQAIEKLSTAQGSGCSGGKCGPGGCKPSGQ
jgi:hypothetical protein